LTYRRERGGRISPPAEPFSELGTVSSLYTLWFGFFDEQCSSWMVRAPPRESFLTRGWFHEFLDKIRVRLLGLNPQHYVALFEHPTRVRFPPFRDPGFRFFFRSPPPPPPPPHVTGSRIFPFPFLSPEFRRCAFSSPRAIWSRICGRQRKWFFFLTSVGLAQL